MNLKEALFNHCETFIDLRINQVQITIDSINEALLSETKSSAGDKHETGRAMLQLEREKTGIQLAEIQKTKELLNKIILENTSEVVRLGSVVKTSLMNYYIAISAGELVVNDEKYYAISPDTPIGKLLLGKKINDSFEFRNSSSKIIEII